MNLPSPLRAARGSFCLASCLYAAGLACVTSDAWAQARSEDRVAAESLFSDARRLMQAGDYEQACPKLEASRRLEPGLGTTLNLGDCYEKLGRTASAWGEFRGAAAEAQKAGDSVRRSTALSRAAALEPRLSRLQISVAEPSVTLLRNGQELSPAVIGNAIPVDPGRYRLEARAPGKLSWTDEVLIEGDNALVAVHVPALADDTAATPAAAAATAPEPVAAEPSHTGETLAWVLGGVGVASIATGATFALLASSSWSKAEDGCTDLPYACSSDAVSQADSASTQATIANVAFIVGGAALGTSLVLFLTSSDDPASTELAITPASVSLRGKF